MSLEITVVQKQEQARSDTYNGIAAFVVVQPNPEAYPLMVMRGGFEDNHVLLLACTLHYMKFQQPRIYQRALELAESGKLPPMAMVGPQPKARK